MYYKTLKKANLNLKFTGTAYGLRFHLSQIYVQLLEEEDVTL